MARAARLAVAPWLAAVAVAGACAGSTENDVASERDIDGGGAKAGTTGGDGAPWPDGSKGGGSASGGAAAGGHSGASGSGASGAFGGTSGTGATGGGSSGSSGGCTPIVCKNWSTCQNESICVSSCPAAPGESCNLGDDNCNGQCDEGASCRTGVHRSYQPSTGEHFYTTSASEAACCGFTVEVLNFYYLYASAQAGLVPFYRCYLSSGFHFYTSSSSCEGASATNEGSLGYIASGEVCGSTPLYRLVLPANNDHFYTTSASEKDSAVSLGYLYEGVAGYVWTSG